MSVVRFHTPHILLEYLWSGQTPRIVTNSNDHHRPPPPSPRPSQVKLSKKDERIETLMQRVHELELSGNEHQQGRISALEDELKSKEAELFKESIENGHKQGRINELEEKVGKLKASLKKYSNLMKKLLK